MHMEPRTECRVTQTITKREEQRETPYREQIEHLMTLERGASKEVSARSKSAQSG